MTGTAVETAVDVLRWAADPAGAHPVGGLRQVGALREPGPVALDSVRGFASAVAARLGAGRPPLGDPSPLGLGVLLLAAAVGGRYETRLADGILAATPGFTLGRDGWAEAVARHGLISAVLAAPQRPGRTVMPPEFAERFRAHSPLTPLLFGPVVGAPARRAARAQLVQLVARPSGPELLTAVYARPDGDEAALLWRSYALEALRADRPALVLDVYEMARLLHAPAWDERIARAAVTLEARGTPDPLSMAIIQFWAPLARLQRDELGRARAGLAGAPDATIKGRVLLDPRGFDLAVNQVRRRGMLPVLSS